MIKNTIYKKENLISMFLKEIRTSYRLNKNVVVNRRPNTKSKRTFRKCSKNFKKKNKVKEKKHSKRNDTPTIKGL